MILSTGDKIHVITRRLFDGDLRRHFVGEVQAATQLLARVEGYAFIFDAASVQFVRKPEKRIRIFGLDDSGLIINLLPADIDLEALAYKYNTKRELILTDGKSFNLDINEFGPAR